MKAKLFAKNDMINTNNSVKGISEDDFYRTLPRDEKMKMAQLFEIAFIAGQLEERKEISLYGHIIDEIDSPLVYEEVYREYKRDDKENDPLYAFAEQYLTRYYAPRDESSEPLECIEEITGYDHNTSHMLVMDARDLENHFNHDIRVTKYNGGETYSLECYDCHEVLCSSDNVELFNIQKIWTDINIDAVIEGEGIQISQEEFTEVQNIVSEYDMSEYNSYIRDVINNVIKKRE